MARKVRVRLSGVLQHLSRGPTIFTDDGGAWIIELADGVELPEAGNVMPEGVQTGLGRLQVDWIGEHPDL